MVIARVTLDAPLKETAADRVAADVQFGTDIGVRPASEMLGNDVIHIQSHRLTRWGLRSMGMAPAAMLALGHQFKVLWRIVGRITISVMHNFPTLEGTSKKALHDDTMLIDQETIGPNHSITSSLLDVPSLVTRMGRPTSSDIVGVALGESAPRILFHRRIVA